MATTVGSKTPQSASTPRKAFGAAASPAQSPLPASQHTPPATPVKTPAKTPGSPTPARTASTRRSASRTPVAAGADDGDELDGTASPTPTAFVKRLFQDEPTPARPEPPKRARLLFGEDDDDREPRPLPAVRPGRAAHPAVAASPRAVGAAGSAAVRRWQAGPAAAAGGGGDTGTTSARFGTEFEIEEQVGHGEFGIVYRCRNKLDGCVYAVKKSKKEVAVTNKAALREVYAHATLNRMGAHENIVRYYSVWREGGHLYIQNEYCDRGNLDVKHTYTEAELRDILHQVAKGLSFIHAHKLVHLDIKPGNILASTVDDGAIPDALKANRWAAPSSKSDRSQSEPILREPADAADAAAPAATRLVYKIGDLGHVTSMETPRLQDGDCRYMAPELLNDDARDLQRADVFSLGMSIYELARHVPLPKNGDEWQALRAGQVPELEGYSKEFNSLLQAMLRPVPADRPTAQAIVDRIGGGGGGSGGGDVAALQKALREEKFRTARLQEELQKRAEAPPTAAGTAAASPSRRKLVRASTTLY